MGQKQYVFRTMIFAMQLAMSSITLWKRRERSRQHRRRSRVVAMKGKQKQIHSHFSNLSEKPTICVAFRHCTKSTQLCATPSEQLYVSVLRLSVFTSREAAWSCRTVGRKKIKKRVMVLGSL